jgi:L,D-transpeptidase ErfK/SrfK
MKKSLVGRVAALALTVLISCSIAYAWNEAEFTSRPLYAYPLPHGHDDIVGTLATYKIQKGDTLLDIGRWYGVSAKDISDANGKIDWWGPPVGREIVLPTEHILPSGPRNGLVLNIPEMRLYYYYPAQMVAHRRRSASRHGAVKRVVYSGGAAQVVYAFPVGLGRFDWKTPVAAWTVTSKVREPTWVVPQDIYEEHLERDGEAEHMIPGGDPDNPLGHYKLDLSLPEYGIHGTNVPWGVGMNVSHGCIRLYPEDIERLFQKAKVGTPGEFVYEPIKFGWRGDALYVEVHDDLYGRYPGLWNLAVQEVRQRGLGDDVDASKLEKAVTAKSGIPTYVMPGPDLSPGIPAGVETASAPMPEPPPNATAAVSAAAPVRNAIDFDTPISSANPTHADYDRAAPSDSTADDRAALPADDTANDDSMNGSDSDSHPAAGNAASSGLPPAHVVPALPVE